MNPIILIGLGPDDEFLGVLSWHDTEKGANEVVESLFPLIMANIEKALPLRERIALAPAYFPFAGRLESVELVDLRDGCLLRQEPDAAEEPQGDGEDCHG